jgi:hypothetical protein
LCNRRWIRPTGKFNPARVDRETAFFLSPFGFGTVFFATSTRLAITHQTIQTKYKTKHNKTKQNKIKQNKTKQNKIKTNHQHHQQQELSQQR